MTKESQAGPAPDAAAAAIPAPSLPVVAFMGDGKREPRHLHRPQNHGLLSNMRSVKMMRPACRSDEDTGFIGCQDEPGARHSNSAWVQSCLAKGHDPYHRMRRTIEVKPQMVEVEPGRWQVTGQDEFVSYVEKPNMKEVQIQPGVAGTYLGLDPIGWKRTHGFILPTEHPSKPYLPFCQYYRCWSQDIVVRDDRYGDYCSEDAARLIVLAYRERPLHVLDRERLAEQLERVKVG